MSRSKILLIFIFTVAFFSCEKDNGTNNPAESDRTIAIKSATAGWKLDNTTKTDNSPLDQNRVTGDSKFVYQLIYVFDKDGNVKSFDKISKVALTYGTWKFLNSDTVLETLIAGQTGSFKVVELTKSKMVLQNDKFEYDNTKITVNMNFSPLQ
jgi:hypothetical protein